VGGGVVMNRQNKSTQINFYYFPLFFQNFDMVSLSKKSTLKFYFHIKKTMVFQNFLKTKIGSENLPQKF
jgi:hypothetical protein